MDNRTGFKRQGSKGFPDPTVHPCTDKVLLLNADFLPLRFYPLPLLSWRHGVRIVFQQRVRVVQEYDRVIHSQHLSMRLPSIVALLRYAPRPNRVAISRHSILVRDLYACQYCGSVHPPTRLTLDHLIPRRLGGQTSWSNLVTSCAHCNTIKGGRRLEEARMTPLRSPTEPPPQALLASYVALHHKHMHGGWREYLEFSAGKAMRQWSSATLRQRHNVGERGPETGGNPTTIT